RDFKSLKIALSNIGVNVPTLYKQYSELTLDDGVKFLDFNVDKNFGDCIDSFILVEIDKIKDSMKQRYM
ncbi:MAG: GNAT family N-acetyltransferase, partial [Aliarcobacter butzleri]|nr:GNAT family N-acetyltransferase [Aliarcobacter butzleri]